MAHRGRGWLNCVSTMDTDRRTCAQPRSATTRSQQHRQPSRLHRRVVRNIPQLSEQSFPRVAGSEVHMCLRCGKRKCLEWSLHGPAASSQSLVGQRLLYHSPFSSKSLQHQVPAPERPIGLMSKFWGNCTIRYVVIQKDEQFFGSLGRNEACTRQETSANERERRVCQDPCTGINDLSTSKTPLRPRALYRVQAKRRHLAPPAFSIPSAADSQPEETLASRLGLVDSSEPACQAYTGIHVNNTSELLAIQTDHGKRTQLKPIDLKVAAIPSMRSEVLLSLSPAWTSLFRLASYR